VLERLGGGARAHRFAAWPNREVPASGPGLYTIWHEDGRFLYAGGAGGLYVRLKSHAAGRRGGDPFCLLVADRLVLPLLSRPEIEGIAAGRIPFDALLRAFIRRRLLYRYAPLANPGEARGWEATLRRGAWAHGAPLLNLDPAARAFAQGLVDPVPGSTRRRADTADPG
jgi:hypothetical protein